jgi:hypothetical protein
MQVIIGAVVSLLVQWVKQHPFFSANNNWYTLALVLFISLLGAAFYQIVWAGGYWDTLVTVLGTAGAVYTFIIARFEA